VGRHLVETVPGNVDDGDVVLGGGANVDVVDPDTGSTDDLEGFERRDDAFGDTGARVHDERIDPGRDLE
jgi:hypothetical protein